jgi:hypothetical protein
MFCYACGQSLTPNGQTAVSPGQPDAPVATAQPTVPAASPPWPGPGVPPYPGQFSPSGAPSTPPWGSAPGPFGAPGPYGAPAGPYGAPPAGYSAPAGPYSAPPAGYSAGSLSVPAVAKPFGIVVLALAEVVTGLVELSVAIDLLRWVNYGLNYSDTGEIPLDLFFGLSYLAISLALFSVARGLWSMQPWAWARACLLNAVPMGLIVLSVFAWGINTLDIVGVAVHLSVLAYLNLNPVRALFGRAPTTFLQIAR